MSDEPPNDPPVSPPPFQPLRPPTQSRMIRGRRPTNLPREEEEPDRDPEDGPSRHRVRILRPSQVPQREPLAEYKEPEPRRIISNKISIEDFSNIQVDPIQNIIVPTFVTATQLLVEAERVGETISFQSTNFEPREVRGQEPELISPAAVAFIYRNSGFIGQKIFGCEAFSRKSDSAIWDVMIEGPVGSVYEGATFFTEFSFNRTNPENVPGVKFKTLMFHPSLMRNGVYDLRSLAPFWTERASIEVLYRHLIHEMVNLKEIVYRKTIEQLEDMAQPNIARLAAGDWDRFETIARELTQKMGGAYAKRTGITMEAKLNDKFTDGKGWARAPTPEIDIMN